MCLYCSLTFYFLAQQYHTEDEDDCAGVDLLNFFIAMTLLGGDDDDDDDDDDNLDFPFSLSGDYGFWPFSILFVSAWNYWIGSKFVPRRTHDCVLTLLFSLISIETSSWLALRLRSGISTIHHGGPSVLRFLITVKLQQMILLTRTPATRDELTGKITCYSLCRENAYTWLFTTHGFFPLL